MNERERLEAAVKLAAAILSGPQASSYAADDVARRAWAVLRQVEDIGARQVRP